jgi:hypothetical protein
MVRNKAAKRFYDLEGTHEKRVKTPFESAEALRQAGVS